MTQSPLPRRALPHSGLSLPILSLGSWHIYDRMPFGEAVDMVRRAVEHGANMFDVGVYGTPGARPPVLTDVIFSAVVRGAGLKREDYLLSEKLWLEYFEPDTGLRGQLEHALFRVGADYADMVVLGDVQDPETDFPALVQSIGDLHRAGLIRAWGVNNWSAAHIATVRALAKVHDVPVPEFAQLKYSVARRAIAEGEPFAALFADGFALQASDVMEGGLLVKPTGTDRAVGRDPGGIRPKIERVARELATLGRDLDATPAELCIAFTLTHDALVNTLVGTSSVSQLEQALNAVDLAGQIGRERLREAVRGFWCDEGLVDPAGP